MISEQKLTRNTKKNISYWGYLAVPTNELNCMHFLNMLYDYVVDGAAMPKHRSHELSLALIDVIHKHVGDVWYNIFTAKTWEEVIMLAENNPYIDNAAQTLYEQMQTV